MPVLMGNEQRHWQFTKPSLHGEHKCSYLQLIFLSLEGQLKSSSRVPITTSFCVQQLCINKNACLYFAVTHFCSISYNSASCLWILDLLFKVFVDLPWLYFINTSPGHTTEQLNESCPGRSCWTPLDAFFYFGSRPLRTAQKQWSKQFHTNP